MTNIRGDTYLHKYSAGPHNFIPVYYRQCLLQICPPPLLMRFAVENIHCVMAKQCQKWDSFSHITACDRLTAKSCISSNVPTTTAPLLVNVVRKFTHNGLEHAAGICYSLYHLTSNNLPPLPKRKCWKHLNANMLHVPSISTASIAWSKGAQNIGSVCCYILCTDICSVSCWPNYNPQWIIFEKICCTLFVL